MVLSPITACVVDGKSTLFFVDDEETVRTYTASDEKEKQKGRTNYTDTVLKVGGKNVQSQVKDMVALSYPLMDGTLRSRLYYADQNRILQGLEKDGSNDWAQSGIGDLRAQVAESSSLTALVSADADAIKVFYYKEGDTGAPWVAWWTPTEGKWLNARTSR